MSANTGIEWTDATWNPVRGCSRVSEGCRNCYAEQVAARFSGEGQAYYQLARRRSNGEPQWTGEVRVIERHMGDPLKWRTPRRIFVNSMSDLFHEKLSDEDIDRVFYVMGACYAWDRGHTFQVLTKRPARMHEYMSDPTLRERLARRIAANSDNGDDVFDFLLSDKAPLFPNVHLGVSVEHRGAADERIPLLLDTPAAVRFVSCEPLLGPLSLRAVSYRSNRGYVDALTGQTEFSEVAGLAHAAPPLPALDWVIVGGESGRGARPCVVQWIRSIVAQCRDAQVACFVKQLGARPWVDDDLCGFARFRESVTQPGYEASLSDRKGGDMAEWPIDLRVREFPRVSA